MSTPDHEATKQAEGLSQFLSFYFCRLPGTHIIFVAKTFPVKSIMVNQTVIRSTYIIHNFSMCFDRYKSILNINKQTANMFINN